MEPTIYKPGIYNGAGVYKTPGIYKGRGVYKGEDGQGYAGYLNLGGRNYPFVKIGSQFWTAENLDWKFSGCLIGASDKPTNDYRGNYYDDDEARFGVNGNKYGLLYNWPAAMYIDSVLNNGWRVPDLEDIGKLSILINPPQLLKSKSGWYNDENGIDRFLFNAVPAGYRQDYFMDLEKVFCMWTRKSMGTYDAEARGFSYNINFITGAWGTNKGFRFSVRLVKDA